VAVPSSICLVKLGAIGDVVNTLPLVHRLRRGRPDARISWVIAPLAHALLEGHPEVDEFLVLDVKRRTSWPSFLRELRSREFELVIDLQRILKSGLVTRLSGAPRRLGFDRARCKELSWLFTNERLATNASPGVTVAQYLEFADHLGLPDCEPVWNLPFTPWSGPPPALCLGVGASKSANLWPVERWAELVRRLVEGRGCPAVPPERIALCGGPQDRAATDALLTRVPAGLLDTVGRLSLKQSAGLIAASELFIGGDTGPLHIAVAVGTPVAALFGAADPLRTGPYLRPQSVIYRPADCSPCRQRDCTIAGHPCMRGIEAAAVLEHIHD
jgi:ADP-heptose:LPS heptosyltransferase